MKKNYITYFQDIRKNILLSDISLDGYFSNIHRAVTGKDFRNFIKLTRSKKTDYINEINDCVHEILLMITDRKPKDVEKFDYLYKTDRKYRIKFFMDLFEAISVERVLFKFQIHESEAVNKELKSKNTTAKNKKFNMMIAGKLRTEKQIYAIASYYAIELALISYEEGDILSFSKLQKDLYKLSLGPSYSSIHGKKGAIEKSKKPNPIKIRAQEIYFENNLYKDKNMSAAKSIFQELEKEKIDAKESTIETSWVPEFKKLYAKQLKNKHS